MTGAKQRLAVARVNNAFRAVATEPIGVGDVITTFEGVVVKKPSRYSIQLGESDHLSVPGDPELPELLDKYPWCFLNHHCDPNAVVRGRSLVALRPIERMDEVTFNYNTTESDMASPFPCGCGAERCNGSVIRGFKHLSKPERERLRPWLAPHILQLMHDRVAMS